MTPQLLPAPSTARKASNDGNSQPAWSSYGPRLILLFTKDRNFDNLLAQGLLGSSAIVLIARSISDALQIVCQRGCELDLAVLEFDDGCRGMTLLSAVHGCYERLPVLVTSRTDQEHVEAVAYANGARASLRKPFAASTLANALAALDGSHHPQLIAA